MTKFTELMKVKLYEWDHSDADTNKDGSIDIEEYKLYS